MSRKRSKRPKIQEKLARDRINKLLYLADSNSLISPEKCINFVKLIGKRYNQRLPNSQRLKFCRKCNASYNLSNSRFRTSKKGWRSITCLDCSSVYRFRI